MVQCKRCGADLKSAQKLARHMRRVHPGRNRNRRRIVLPKTSVRVDYTPRRKTRLRVPVMSGINTQRLAPMNDGGISSLAINRSLANESLGSTAQGSYWAMRALHPCDETRGGGAPIPDQSETESANLEYRVDSIITRPGTTEGQWDCQLLFLPFGELPIAYRRRLINNAWSEWYGFAPNGSFVQPGDLALGTGDGGAEPPTWVPPQNVTTPTLFSQTTGFRATYRGITVILNASSLANEGYLTAGQWSNTPELDKSALGAFGSEAPPDAKLYDTYLVKDVPSDPSDIITRCPEAGQWEARKGLYMPIRFPNPAHQYTSPVAYEQDGVVGAEQVVNIPVAITPVVAGQPNYVMKLGAETHAWTVSGVINLNLGTVIFSGLNSNASLVIKCRSGLELIPEKDTTAAGFIKSSPMQDDVAIKAVQGISSKMPLVYEARFNSLGAIVPAIMSVAKHVLPVVAPWLIGKIRGLFAGGAKSSPPARYVEEAVD